LLPISGITFSQKTVNVSEVVPEFTWLVTLPLQCVLRICVAKASLPGQKWDNIHENYLNVGGNLPRDSLSDRRMYLFQSCCGVGCRGAVTLITSAERREYILEGTFISWY
jgi:hypothetical protein